MIIGEVAIPKMSTSGNSCTQWLKYMADKKRKEKEKKVTI